MFQKIKLAALALLAIILAPAAFAINTYVARDYTCAQLQSIVQSEGDVYLSAWWGEVEYHASNSGQCPGDEIWQSSYIHSSDAFACNVGWACAEQNHGGDGGGGHN